MFGIKKQDKKEVPYKIKKVIKKFSIPLPEQEIAKLGKKYVMIESGEILAFLMNRTNRISQLVQQKKKLMTTDRALYEAIASARGNREIGLEKLKFVLFHISIVPEAKKLISRERMNEVRRAYGGI